MSLDSEDFLINLKINKRTKRPCRRCDEKFWFASGEWFCSDCKKKNEKDDVNIYRISPGGVE